MLEILKLKIKNWSKFQHFKDRRPPWIKLHKELLDQRDINAISDRSFRVLINLWLIASEDPELNGNLPTIEDIAWRTRMSEEDITKAIQELGGFVDHSDITLISERYQVGPPEERRGEAEAETETKKEKKVNGRFTPPSVQDVKDYCQSRNNNIDPETFVDHYEANGWFRGKNKIKCWKSCVRTWEKSPRRHETPKRELGAKTNERLRKEFERSRRESAGTFGGDVPELIHIKET